MAKLRLEPCQPLVRDRTLDPRDFSVLDLKRVTGFEPATFSLGS